jgi:aminopeptidase C
MGNGNHSTIESKEKIRNIYDRLARVESQQDKLSDEIARLRESHTEERAIAKSNYKHLINIKENINTEIQKIYKHLTKELNNTTENFDYKFFNNEKEHNANREAHRNIFDDISDIKETQIEMLTEARTAKEHAENSDRHNKWILAFIVGTSLAILTLLINYLL